MKKLLITGASGLLGSNLAHCLNSRYRILGLYYSQEVALKNTKLKKADILSSVALKKVVDEFSPDIVLHAAALADMEFCQSNPALTDQVNVVGTKNVVECIKGKTIKLIYISTDSVYGGDRHGSSENDPIKPLSHYSVSKYKGEQESLKHPDTLILRTSFFGWNIIPGKLSLAEWIISELSQKRSIRGFQDVYCSIIYTFKLAEIIHKMIEKNLRGIFNCASADALSKYDFVIKLAEQFRFDVSGIIPESVDNFPFKAKRSKDLSLDTRKLSQELCCALPTMAESIEAFYEDYHKGIPQQLKAGV